MSPNNRIRHLTPEFVDSFPTELQPGTLYISIPYRTCGHLCCCGCGEEVITPLSPTRWRLTYNGATISLAPSIGSWSLPCRSHYWIKDGEIVWSRAFSPREIVAARAEDQAALGRDRGTPDRQRWWERLRKGR